MADYPQTVMEFHDWFSSEEDCRAYLVRTRWPEGIQCPRCQARKPWQMKEPFYRCSGCGHDFTVTAGTLFADTHKPLRVWFEAMWHVTNQKNGVSALGLQRALGLGSYIGPLGTGCTSCVAPWCGRVEIDWRGSWKSMKPLSAASNQANEGEEQRARA